MFDTNLHNERFLLFEGASGQNTWRLELSAEFRHFDYDTISDVILHLRYTARQCCDQLRGSAIEHSQVLIR